MAADGILGDLNDGIGGPDLDSDGEHNSETPREQIETLMAGMDPVSRNEIAVLLAVDPQVLDRREYIQQGLRLAQVKSTECFDAPDMPFTKKSVLARIPGGYDIYESGNNRVVTVLVGSKMQKFTAISGALAADAEFFKPLCDDRWECGRAGVIELEDYQPETFGIFITSANGPTRGDGFQLLRCYHLADYIGAPRFANHMMDALVLAYRDWAEDDQLPKAGRDPLFVDRQTKEMVGENTAESSPLRIMISDILSSLPVLRSSEASTSFLRPFRRRAKSQNYLPLGHPAQHSPSSAHSHSMNASNALPDLPPNHPLPPHLQIPPPQYQAGILPNCFIHRIHVLGPDLTLRCFDDRTRKIRTCVSYNPIVGRRYGKSLDASIICTKRVRIVLMSSNKWPGALVDVLNEEASASLRTCAFYREEIQR